MQVIWLGCGQLIRCVSICDVPVLAIQVKLVKSAWNLGIIIDSQLSLSAHVTVLCCSDYSQLRQLHPDIQSLTADAVMTLVQRFTCHLDYWNLLLYRVSNNLMQKIQSVQNATTRLSTIARRYAHNTAVLQKLHWLPVCRRVAFKLACLMHQSLTDKHRRILLLTFSLLLTLATLCFDLRLRGYASFYAYVTASVIEVSLLPVLVCGMPCHHICGRMWTTDILSKHWKDTFLGCSWPWCIVTKELCILEAHLLSKLLT